MACGFIPSEEEVLSAVSPNAVGFVVRYGVGLTDWDIPTSGVYYAVFDEYGVLRGGASSASTEWLIMGYTYNDYFQAGSEFAIYAILGNSIYHVGITSTNEVESQDDIPNIYSDLYGQQGRAWKISSSNVYSPASSFGQTNKCPYYTQNQLQSQLADREISSDLTYWQEQAATYEEVLSSEDLVSYCVGMPFNKAQPALDAFDEAVANGENRFLISAMNLYSASIQVANGDNISFNPNVPNFFIGVDNNGIIRLSGILQNDSGHVIFGGAMFPFIYGAPTNTFGVGDEVSMYFVQGTNLYYIHSGISGMNGKFTVPEQELAVQTTEIRLVDGTDYAPCLPNLNTNIWGLIDEVGETYQQAALVPDLQEQIGEQDSFFELWADDSNAQSINNQIFAMQTALGIDPSEEGVDDE